MGEPSVSLEFSREELRGRVTEILRRLSVTGALPALSATASAALAMARDPDTDVKKLCRIIQTDVGLAARLTRFANSAAMARRTPARTLADAVMVIGLRKTCDILVAANARQLYSVSAKRAHVLWDHALAVAVAAEELARRTRRVDPAYAFLPGLFHDVGRIAFLISDEPSFDVIEELTQEGDQDRRYLETEWYGFDHAEAGAILTEDWGLALEQCDAIRMHHAAAEAGAARDLASVLAGADFLAYRIGCGTDPEPPEGINLEHLGLPPEKEAECVEKVSELLRQQKQLLG